jgi:hypothetical protein
MISRQLYVDIAKKYGRVASWAVWDQVGEKPKSNISNMGIFDVSARGEILNVLRTDIVFVALNFSRDVEMQEPFLNFHDANPYGQDYKLRHALVGTDFYGAYMTDLVKDFPQISSKDVMKHLKENPCEIMKQIDSFKDEMKFIGAEKPTILALGRNVYDLLKRHLDESYYSNLISLMHYSHQISKEKYRGELHKKLGL